MQQQNNVPEKFRGPWYHETYDNIGALDNQHDEWTWFTRSPSRGTIWGETVLIAYVVAVPEYSKVHATSNKGDKVGHEGEDALPDWWMSVGREDIPKLMVVSKFYQKNDEDKLKALLGTDVYKAIRQAAIDKLQALPLKHEDIAVAAYYIWEKDGKVHGKDKVHWDEAIKELRSRKVAIQFIADDAEISCKPRRINS